MAGELDREDLVPSFSISLTLSLCSRWEDTHAPPTLCVSLNIYIYTHIQKPSKMFTRCGLVEQAIKSLGAGTSHVGVLALSLRYSASNPASWQPWGTAGIAQVFVSSHPCERPGWVWASWLQPDPALAIAGTLRVSQKVLTSLSPLPSPTPFLSLSLSPLFHLANEMKINFKLHFFMKINFI